MEQNVEKIYQIVQKLIGLHRQLLDTVRMEREALVNASLTGLQEAVYAKEALIEAIRSQESERMKCLGVLAVEWKKNLSELTLPNLIVAIQGKDLKSADLLRSAFNALTILIERISEQNRYNQGLVETSLEHVNQMKKNVLGESVPHRNTYNQQGQKKNNVTGARLISKEA